MTNKLKNKIIMRGGNALPKVDTKGIVYLYNKVLMIPFTLVKLKENLKLESTSTKIIMNNET